MSDIAMYTGEPIYFYMIGKNARHNQVLRWLEITMNLGHYGPTQVFWDWSTDHIYWLIPDYGVYFYQSYKNK